MNPQDYIPKPCHEDWSKMTGDDRKKFCAKCSTSVHNLTGMSHEEILELRKQNGGKLCGSFRSTKPTRVTLTKPLAIGASIASLALASCKEDNTIAPVVGECVIPPEEHVVRGEVKAPSSTLKGKIIPLKKVHEEEILLGDISPVER